MKISQTFEPKFFTIDKRSSYCYYQNMTTTIDTLNKTSEDIIASKKKVSTSNLELNRAIQVIASSAEQIEKAVPKIGNMGHYSSLTNRTNNWMMVLGMSLYTATLVFFMAQVNVQVKDNPLVILLENIWMNILSILIVSCWQLWYQSTHVDTYKMVERIEEKGSLSRFKLITMRLFNTRKQWKRLTKASNDVQRYNEEVKAWNAYKSKIINSEENLKALETVNNSSPRRKIYFTQDGEVDWLWKRRATPSVTEANIRDWITP